ncbi:MAG: benzoate-CoA ligase family protein [Xanthobacteraceae bacterium]
MSDVLKDPVQDGLPGSLEIGFEVPDRYNASRILWDNILKGNGDRVAVRASQGDLTYSALVQLAARAGNQLLALGLKRVARVILLLADTPAYPAFIFGAIRAGLVPVLTNTQTPADLINFYLKDTGARVIVVDAALSSLISEEAVKDAGLDAVIVVNGAAPAMPHVRQVISFDQASAKLSPKLDEADTGRDDMAFWMYSSGSTGRPKGIVHLQHDMLYSALSYSDHFLKLKPDDICFSVPKIFFAYGFGNAITFPFLAGASALLLADRPEPKAVCQAIRRHKPTVFFGVPTIYTMLVKSEDIKTTDFSSIRLCVSAAEVLATEIFQSWKDVTGLEIVEGLGSTEVLHIYLSNSENNKRPGAAGKRVPGYEVRLTDADGREIADDVVDVEGVLWVRGHSNAPCYWNRPDKTAETMRGDWLYTGDRFRRDADGFYYFRGRADDLIKVSGQWVYPLEVELCLADHVEIREVCVMGVQLPDQRMTLKAFIVPMNEPTDDKEFTLKVQDFVKKKLLPYKYPREVVLLKQLPKTGTGKIDRQALAKLETR